MNCANREGLASPAFPVRLPEKVSVRNVVRPPGNVFFCFLSRGARALPQLFIVSGRSRHLSPPPMANGFFHLASDRAIARLSHDPLSSLPSTLPSSPLLPPSPAHRSPAFPPSPSFFLRRPTCCPAPGQRFRDLFRNVVRPPGNVFCCFNEVLTS